MTRMSPVVHFEMPFRGVSLTRNPASSISAALRASAAEHARLP